MSRLNKPKPRVPGLWQLIAIVVTALSLAACGGGSSGGDSSAAQESSSVVSGVVTDPAIEQSAVRLVDVDGNALTSIVRTDGDGSFRFELSDQQLGQLAAVVAIGGRDVETGADLQGVTLRADVSTSGEFVVSPLTTLAANASDNLSAQQLADLLNLSSAEELDDNPADNPDVQVLSLKLTEITKALRDTGLEWADFIEELQLADGDLTGAFNGLAAANTERPLLAVVAGRLGALDTALVNPEPGVGTVQLWNRLQFESGLARFYRESLSVVESPETTEAIARIAQAVWEANGRKGVDPDSPGIDNLGRYLISIYGLDSDSLTQDLVVPDEVVTDDLVAFVASIDFIDHELPLAQEELLNDDNETKAQYFLSSDLSPFYKVETLFTGLYDDAITDPVYAQIAVGLAAAGLDERAELIALSKIFQPSERADAFRKIGKAFFDSGNTEKGSHYLDLAADIYLSGNGVLAQKGVENLSFDDTRFLQNLSTNYGQAGLNQKAIEVLEPVESFRDQFGGSGAAWSGNYSNLTYALLEQAINLVEQAEAEGLVGSSVQQALDYTNLAASWIDNMPVQPGPITCAALQTQYTSRYVDLYSRLGENTKALAGIEKFEPLLSVACNGFARFYVGTAAAPYVRLGLIDRYETLLTEKVEGQPFGADAVTAARLELAVFKAVDAARTGNASSAIEVMTAQVPDVLDRVYHMVYQIRGLSFQGTPLVAQLLEADLPAAAEAAAENAWSLAVSDDFIASTSTPKQLVAESCAAAARATATTGREALALERMNVCANTAAARYGDGAATQDRIDADIAVANGYVALGEYPETQINRAKGLVASITESDDQLELYRELVVLQSNAGRPGEAIETLDTLSLPVLNTMMASADSVDAANTLAKELEDVAADYADIATATRKLLATWGTWNPENAAYIQQARARVADMAKGNASSPLVFGGALEVFELLDDNNRVLRSKELVVTLAEGRHYELAESISRTSTYTTADRNAMLSSIAEKLSAQDDYPGTDMARFDFDGDSNADFFDPQSSTEEQAAAPFEVDDDIDGDGTNNSLDETPYCAICINAA